MSHQQDIERIVEQMEPDAAPIPAVRVHAILRAALAAAQRDRYQLERQVEQLQAELRAALKPAVSTSTHQYWLDTVLGWAEVRLMPPQFDECKRALVGHENVS